MVMFEAQGRHRELRGTAQLAVQPRQKAQKREYTYTAMTRSWVRGRRAAARVQVGGILLGKDARGHQGQRVGRGDMFTSLWRRL